MTDTAQQNAPIQIEEDKHWWFAGRTWSLLNMIDQFVEPDGSQKVLDIGCGAGNMFHHLARSGPVVGVDNNPRPLARLEIEPADILTIPILRIVVIRVNIFSV